MDVGSVQVTVTPFVDRGAGTVPTLEDDPLFEEERQASNNALIEFLREGAPATPGDVSSESESSFVSPPRARGGTNAAGGGEIHDAMVMGDGGRAGILLAAAVAAARLPSFAGVVRTREQMGATSLPSSPGRGKIQATDPEDDGDREMSDQ